ncbi:inorganic diphosphatase [Anaeromyxobacter terrae]|uniref:inorganic diphosphatase n=1 Tax=Anaeromyxobacter terrae TaxID=2925406 RepID=UPI001F5A3CF1|nr:inorganic diphosphatase [Anaeromyxobacter sp. SG22]
MAYHPWHDVELPRFIEEPIPAIIEIATGSKVKYELDKKSGLLLVDRILFSSVHYPANYGFVPRTYCDDGDPLDVLVLCQEAIVPLAIMRAKVIGVMKMRDDKGEDDKLIAVHADDPTYSDYTDISEIPSHKLRELKRFFEDYKALENKKVLVSEPQGRSEGLQVLRDAIRLYDQEKDRLMEAPLAPVAAPKARRSRRAKPSARKAAASTKARRR